MYQYPANYTHIAISWKDFNIFTFPVLFTQIQAKFCLWDISEIRDILQLCRCFNLASIGLSNYILPAQSCHSCAILVLLLSQSWGLQYIWYCVFLQLGIINWSGPSGRGRAERGNDRARSGFPQVGPLPKKLKRPKFGAGRECDHLKGERSEITQGRY